MSARRPWPLGHQGGRARRAGGGRRDRAPALALLLLAQGCALDAGAAFVELLGGELQVGLRLDPARALGDRRLLTDLGYRFTVQTATVAIAELTLEEVEGGAGGSFDPAHPPPGYSLCHSGHCHAADGALVSYEDIQAELAGGTEAFAPVVRLPVAQEVELWSAPALVLATVEPSTSLPRATLARAVLRTSGLNLAGTVSGGPLGEAELPVQLTPGGALAFAVRFAEVIDRSGAPRRRLVARLNFDGTIADDLDFAALASGGRVVIRSGADPGAGALAAALLRTRLQVAFEESRP